MGGELSLDGGEYDQIFGKISDNYELNNGQSTLSGDVCVACSIINQDQISGAVIGAFGNAIIGNQINAVASSGQLNVSSGQYFSSNSKITELPDFIGLAGNIINADSGSAVTNSGAVKISGGSVSQVDLSSGSWQASGVSGNYVRINDGNGNANYGQVEVSGGSHTISFFGNQLYSPEDAELDASNGSLVVTNQASVGSVHGNYVYGQNGSVDAINGVVTVLNASVNGNVLGNFSFSWTNSATSAKGNINLDNASIDINSAYGIIASAAESQSGTAKSVGGSVIIKNTSVNGGVPSNSFLGITGAFANVIFGDDYSTAVAESGCIKIENSSIALGDNSQSLYVVGSFAKVNGGKGDVLASNGVAVMYSGSLNGSLRGAISRTVNGSASAFDNQVLLYGGELVDATLYGAYVYINNGTGDAISGRNSVLIDGGTVDGTFIAGTHAKAEEGISIAKNNTIVISDGNVSADFVFGALAQSESEAMSNNNLVLLSGYSDETIVEAEIYGGYAQARSSSSLLDTSSNIISIEGYKLDISGSSLYGGNTGEITGNTLNVTNFQGSVKVVGNFETINFKTNLDDINWGDNPAHALLRLTEGIDNTREDLETKVNLIVLNGNSLSEGGTYTVVSGSGAHFLVGNTLDIQTNGLIDVNAVWDNKTTDQFNIHINEIKPSDDSGLVSTPDIVTSMLVSCSDFLLEELMPKNGLFAIAQANTVSTDLNADMDVDGFNAMIGAVGDFRGDTSMFRFAEFIEYGQGEYDAKRNSADSEGEVYFYNVGLQAKLFHDSGWINEASVRMGKVHSKGSFLLNDGLPFKVKKKSSYVTAHVGVGWQGETKSGVVFNPYARYHYLRIGDSSDEINGETLKWGNYVVQRSIVGVNLKTTKDEQWNWEIGAAWEHIFDADTSAHYGDIKLDSWNMEGNSGLLHGAMVYQFGRHPEWNLELAGKVRFGDYQGYATKLTVWRHL